MRPNQGRHGAHLSRTTFLQPAWTLPLLARATTALLTCLSGLFEAVKFSTQIRILGLKSKEKVGENSLAFPRQFFAACGGFLLKGAFVACKQGTWLCGAPVAAFRTSPSGLVAWDLVTHKLVRDFHFSVQQRTSSLRWLRTCRVPLWFLWPSKREAFLLNSDQGKNKAQFVRWLAVQRQCRIPKWGSDSGCPPNV